MSVQVQLRRGTTANHSTFTGAAGEVTVDTTKKVVIVHDGATAGGIPMARADAVVLADGTVPFTGDVSAAGNIILTGAGKGVIFEGTTADAFETTLVAGEPTADRTVTLPDATTTLAGLAVAQTWTADQTLAENASIVLDAALSADGKYCGVVESGTSSAALAFGELCYRVTATGKWALARGAAADVGTVVATGELGICVLAAGGADATTTILKYGKVRADALFDTFTVGAPIYMSAATAGKIVSAAPSGTTDFTVRKVGHAEDANTVFFNPSNDFITLA
jgi:hypothetical protein